MRFGFLSLLFMLGFSNGSYADFDPTHYDAVVRTLFPDAFATLERQEQTKKTRHTDGLGVRLFSNPKEEATDWGLLVPEPVIDHTWISTAQIEDQKVIEFPATAKLPAIADLRKSYAEKRFAPQSQGGVGKWEFSAVLLAKPLTLLLDRKAVRLPLLVSGSGIYRAQSACLSDNGVTCTTPLPDAITSPLLEETPLSGGAWINGLSETLDWRTRLNRPDARSVVLIQYLLVSQTQLDPGSFKNITGLVHPGYSPYVLKLEKALYDRYQEVFAGQPGFGPTDFVGRIRIGDCDTTAVAIATLNPEAHLQLAVGNLPTVTGFIDIWTANHGWNVKIEGSGELNSMDLTPAASHALTFGLNQAAYSQAVARVAQLTQGDFSLERLFDSSESAIVLADLIQDKQAEFSVRQILQQEFDLAGFKIENAPNYPPKILERTHLSLSTHTQTMAWGQYFLSADQSVFLAIDKHIYPGRPGELVFGSYRDGNDGTERVQLSEHLPQGAEAGRTLYTLNFDLERARGRSFKTHIVDHKVSKAKGRRGYRWPDLTEAQMLSVWADFQQAFPQVSEFDAFADAELDNGAFFSGPNSMKNGADRTTSGYGVLVISHGDREFINPETAGLYQQRFDTAALVNFWRGHGFKVIPTLRHTWEVMMYLDE